MINHSLCLSRQEKGSTTPVGHLLTCTHILNVCKEGNFSSLVYSATLQYEHPIGKNNPRKQHNFTAPLYSTYIYIYIECFKVCILKKAEFLNRIRTFIIRNTNSQPSPNPIRTQNFKIHYKNPIALRKWAQFYNIKSQKQKDSLFTQPINLTLPNANEHNMRLDMVFLSLQKVQDRSKEYSPNRKENSLKSRQMVIS